MAQGLGIQAFLGQRRSVQPPEDMLLMSQHQFVPKDSQHNFEQRILNPSKYPTLDLGNGDHATHKMSYSSADDKFLAYPSVVQKGNKLVELDNKEAYRHAIENGEYRTFNDEVDASNYARGGYKNQWGANEPKPETGLIGLIEQYKATRKGR